MKELWEDYLTPTPHKRIRCIENQCGDWYCAKCGNFIGKKDPQDEFFINEKTIERWNYCPVCGTQLIK